MTTATQTVREIAQQQPSSIRVFEQFGIEYCCGGNKPLADACAAKDVDVEKVIAALEAASRSETPQMNDWTRETLTRLTEHIVAMHHANCKEDLARLSGLAARVVHRHGGTNPELTVIQAKVSQLAEELAGHLAEEEVVVFPTIMKLEGKKSGTDAKADESDVPVRNLLALLIQEHDHAGVLLAEIRGLSHEFVAPEHACTTYRAFFDGLQEFERSLHRHVHLENNILFPRAIELATSRS